MKRQFIIDLEMLHLAIELGAAQAMRDEVKRQFDEQFPDSVLTMDTGAWVSFDVLEREDIQLNVDHPDYEVVIK